jgi:hypothetical protein
VALKAEADKTCTTHMTTTGFTSMNVAYLQGIESLLMEILGSILDKIPHDTEKTNFVGDDHVHIRQTLTMLLEVMGLLQRETEGKKLWDEEDGGRKL